MYIVRKYSEKATGATVSVVCDEGKDHIVTISANGIANCTREDGAFCPDRVLRPVCRHVKHVKQQDDPTYDAPVERPAPNYLPAVGGCYSFRKYVAS